MSNYYTLKTAINANIKQNGNQEITGPILNSVLNQMVNILGTGYQFAGIATPATNPGTPDAKVFYIANGKETYEKFGGLEVTEDEVVVLYWDTAWHKVSTGIAREEKLTDLENEIATKQDIIPDLDSIRAGAALGASALQEETDPNVPSWAKAATKPSYTPDEIGAATEESLQAHENDNTRHITASERAKWDAKQDALTLTIKDNGNIVLANIQGQSKEFMPATPSGDPMHKYYISLGMKYSNGFFLLNGLNLTASEALETLVSLRIVNQKARMNGCRNLSFRTNIPDNYATTYSDPNHVIDMTACFAYNLKLEVVNIANNSNINYPLFCIMNSAFLNCNKLKKIIDYIKIISASVAFQGCSLLSSVNLVMLSISVSFASCPLLSSDSILFMINNEEATSAITITLHADAYARAMANADIVAALEAHPNLSLASA